MILSYCSLLEDLCTQNVTANKNSNINKPQLNENVGKNPLGTFRKSINKAKGKSNNSN